MKSLQFILFAAWLWVLPCIASLVQSTSCASNVSAVRLANYVMDVVISDNHDKLQFYITSQVINNNDVLDTSVIINDVNTTSNRWTNMHVEILFMGKQFIDENVRFCDIVNVKNTLEYLLSPRFQDYLSVSGPAVVSNGTLTVNERRKNDKRQHELETMDLPTLMARDNKSDDFSAPRNFTHKPQQVSENNVFNYTSTLVAAHCPLYVNDTITFFYEADIGKNYHRLGSYTVKFTLISNEVESQIISCNKAYITPTQPSSIYTTIMIGVLLLLLVTGGINFFTVMYSSYQESSNPLLFTASTIGNEKLLKQLECSVTSILQYLQFALFIGALDLQYPGFYQPLISQFKWCALLGISLIGIDRGGRFHKHSPRGPSTKDFVYSTFNKRGLQSLTEYSTDRNSIDCWPNFMLVLTIWIIMQILAKQLFIYIKEFILLVRGNRYMMIGRESRLDLSKNLSLILGEIFNNILNLFSLPFLTLTLYIFSLALETKEWESFYPFLSGLSHDIYDPYSSYKSLFLPRFNFHSWQHESGNFTLTNSNLTSTPKLYPSTLLYNDTVTNITSSFQSRPNFAIPARVMAPAIISFILWCALALFFTFNFLFTIKKVYLKDKKNTFWETLIPFRICQNSNVSKLYTSLKTILIWGFSYHHLEPTKIFYLTVPYSSIFLKLIVIGTLQNYGCAQVTILSIIEFLEICVLIYHKPYFIKIRWFSTRMITPFAKLVVTLLCIPYIRQLDLSEARRTYVAYAQLLIHVIVAVIFILQLLYGLGMTVYNIIKENSKRSEGDTKIVNMKKIKSHEYRGISKLEEVGGFDGESSTPPYLMSDRFNVKFDSPSEEEIENEDAYYFRGAAANRVKGKHETATSNYTEEDFSEIYNKPEKACFRNDSFTDANDHLLRSISDLGSSFHEQQKSSYRRRKENDYTFREGDFIYKKFLVDDSIDPEIKALWNLRTQNQNQNQNHNQNQKVFTRQCESELGLNSGYSSRLLSRLRNESSQLPDSDHQIHKVRKPNSFFINLFKKIKKAEIPVKSFEIDRPRHLIIKTREQMEQMNEKSMSSNLKLPSPASSASLLSTLPEENQLNIDNQHTSEEYGSTDSLVIIEDNNRSDSWLFIPQQY